MGIKRIFRNMKNSILGIKKTPKMNFNDQTIKLLNGYTAEYIFSNKNNIYNNQIARTAIDTISTQFAKLTPKHLQNNRHIKGEIDYLLRVQPNSMMSSYDFLYKVCANLHTFNNAFIFIDLDQRQRKILGFYPVNAEDYEILEDEKGAIFLKFRLYNGKHYILPYRQLIHLRKFYNKNNYSGENNDPLIEALDTQETSVQGIKNAIRLSNSLKGIIKLNNNMFKSQDLSNYRNQFVEDFLDDESGIAALDSRAEFEPISIKPLTLDEKQQKQVNDSIYTYFRISEEIVNSNYTEEQWNAFYRSVIEPLVMQFSQEVTNKVFSQQAIKNGHKIIMSADIMSYSSVSTKISLIKELSSLGVITKNEIRSLFNLLPLENVEGDKILQSLNYVDSDIANKYQLNKTNSLTTNEGDKNEKNKEN